MPESLRLPGGIDVVWFVSYPPQRSVVHPKNADVSHLVRALKRMTADTGGDATLLNRQCSLDTRTIRDALRWFGTIGALTTEMLYPRSPVVFVPIPDSASSCDAPSRPRATRLAQAVVENMWTAAVICDCLRWKRRQLPSHQGGTRDRERLYRELCLTQAPKIGTLILVDDVVTTGAHIMAAATKLVTDAHIPCSRALCLARAEPPGHHVFSIRQATLLPVPIAAYSVQRRAD